MVQQDQDTKAPRIIMVFSLTWALGVISVGLRILSRRMTNYKLWLDDWLIITSLVRNIRARCVWLPTS